MKPIFILLVAGWTTLAAEVQPPKLPKWAEVFPNATLWNQSNLPRFQTYAYSTDTGFEQLKAQLQNQLGKDWKQQPVPPELSKNAGKDLLGIATFRNPAFPTVSIGLVQNANDTLGKKTLAVVTVMGVE